MIIGVPREIKPQENRVAMIPEGVGKLTAAGHPVLVERGAGSGSGISDEDFLAAGAEIVSSAAEVWDRAAMVVKVKEPLPAEYPLLRENLILFTYLHLAPLPELTEQLLASKVTAIGYETVQLADGSLPLLAPMSEVAGKLSIQAGAHYLEKEQGGLGILLGGVSGVDGARVLIIGSGTVGTSAARVALGMGAKVTMAGRNPDKLARISREFQKSSLTLETAVSGPEELAKLLPQSELVIGAVLIPGGRAPCLVSRRMVQTMRKGSVIVDVAIDQGGCFATSRATTHREPVYEEEGVIHYCVANMPGAVPRTSTSGLTRVTLPYVLQIANRGLIEAVDSDPALRKGVDTHQGFLHNRDVAEAQNRDWCELRF
ncbi:MAG: alanine dehydrogenase [Proteobacteria bacterium]|nr:alanine dehydrogenase [Pseudomonadota bacterium]MBU1738264.1 alanine dehydrogenase [Pseudomonadota bacterium]